MDTTYDSVLRRIGLEAGPGVVQLRGQCVNWVCGKTVQLALTSTK